jgi:hypothetical protein
MREAKEFARATAPDFVQMVNAANGGSANEMATLQRIKAQAVAHAKAEKQAQAQAQAVRMVQAQAEAKAARESQTAIKGKGSVKSMSPREKAQVQHLQLQAQYQKSLSVQMQKRVEDEVHAVLSTTQQGEEAGKRAQPRTNQQTEDDLISRYNGSSAQFPPQQRADGFQQQLGLGMDEEDVKPLTGLKKERRSRATNKSGGAGLKSGEGVVDLAAEDADGAEWSFENGGVAGEGPPVEKLATRRDRNREHARKSRLRKKLLVVAQQQRMTELEHTNRILVEALQKYASPGHLNAILAGAVQGGMAAAMTPMAEPTLPRSQRNPTGGEAAGDSDEEDGSFGARGKSDCHHEDAQSSRESSPAGSPGPTDRPLKVQVQAAHLQAELGILEALKRSLGQREQAVVARERQSEQRTSSLINDEKKLAAMQASLVDLQARVTQQHSVPPSLQQGRAGLRMGNHSYDIGGSKFRGEQPPSAGAEELGGDIGSGPWVDGEDGEKAVDEMMQMMMNGTDVIPPIAQTQPFRPPNDADSMDFTSESHLNSRNI